MILLQQDSSKIYTIAIAVCMFIMSFFSLVFEFWFLSYFCEFIFLCIVCAKVYMSIFKIGEQRDLWIMLSLSIILWLACDMIWYLYRYLLEKPYAELEFLHLTYLCPMLFIVFGLGLYIVYRFFRDIEDKFLIFNDSIGIILMLGIFVVSIFKDYEFIHITESITHFAAFLAIVFSFIILYFVLASLFASNIIVIHMSFFYVIISCGLFALISIFYYYNVLFNEYKESRFLSLFYLISFFILMLGSYELQGANKKIKSKNINFSIATKWLPVVCAIPLVLQTDIDAKISFFITLILLGHILLSYYIKTNGFSKKLLQKEQSAIIALEKNVTRHTNELILANLKLKDMIEKDYLTGLASRGYLMERLDSMLKNQIENESVVVFHINIRRFKLANSSYGHIVGDKILKVIAKRISMLCDQGKVAGRLSADEFIVIAKFQDQDKERYLQFSHSIIDSLGESIQVDSYHFMLNCIVGIDVANFKDKKDSKTLIRNADKAMHFIKEAPMLNPLIYSDEIERFVKYDSEVDILINQADIHKDFEIYLQPVIDIKTKNIVSAEALLRWNSKELGFLEASKFINIIQNSNLINKIYDFVLDGVIDLIKDFRYSKVKLPKISINISPKQNSSLLFIQKLDEIITKQNVDPSFLEVELDESVWMNNIGTINEVFNALKEIGVSVCIDDFGTGYSSLVYIKKYNINRIKISSELMHNINKSPSDAQIVKSIIGLSRIMGIKSVAKGVEKEENIKFLEEFGCDEVQGYAISKPMSIIEFKKLLYKTTIDSVKMGGGDAFLECENK